MNGRCVTPGMIDAHLHLMYYGQTKKDFVDLRPPEITTLEELLAKIEASLQEVEPGEWINGDGFFNLDRFPTKYDLDPISPDNPVFLNSMGGHFGSANSAALNAAGITAETPDPVGGIIERDSLTGEPTGVLWNHPAMNMVRMFYPTLDVEDLKEDILFAQERCIPVGITSYQDVNTRGMTRVLGYYNALDSLKVRATIMFTVEYPEDADISLEQLFVYKGPWLSLPGDKFLIDGQPPTSYTYDPHPGPSWDLPTWNPDTLKAVVKELHRAGHQLAFHCMGDHCIDLVLDALEEALIDFPRDDHRHRLEHFMIPTEAALDRVRDLNLIVSLQPSAIYTSGEFYIRYWGQERIQRLKPFRSCLDRGIPVALGTDFPTVLRIAPKYTLWSSIVRMTDLGIVINASEGVTIQEALYAQTMGSAYAAFEEDVKGSIEVGKYADMVVWSDDLYTIPTEQLPDVYVISTIIAGTVYNNPNVGVEETQEVLRPSDFRLHQNYPNPFNAMTVIPFTLPHAERVRIDLLNVKGQVVQNIANRVYDAGYHTESLDGRTLSSGIYFIRMEADRFHQVVKMELVK